VQGNLDPTTAVSNTFTMEWPPGSGRIGEFPEFDRSAWFDLATATRKLVKGQVAFVQRLAEYLGEPLDVVR
jgi:predicted NUDIX family NTP pyrophosphohydrolase